MSADTGSPEAPGAAVPAAPPVSALADAPPAEKQRSWLVAAIARGLALFIGAFTLVNVVALWRLGADFNIWWVAVPGAGRTIAIVLYVLVGAALVGYAALPGMRPWRRSQARTSPPVSA